MTKISGVLTKIEDLKRNASLLENYDGYVGPDDLDKAEIQLTVRALIAKIRINAIDIITETMEVVA